MVLEVVESKIRGFTHLGSGESHCPDGRLLASYGALLCWQGQTGSFSLFHDSPPPEGPLMHERLPNTLPLNTHAFSALVLNIPNARTHQDSLSCCGDLPTIKSLCCYIIIVILLLL